MAVGEWWETELSEAQRQMYATGGGPVDRLSVEQRMFVGVVRAWMGRSIDEKTSLLRAFRQAGPAQKRSLEADDQFLRWIDRRAGYWMLTD